MTMGPRFQGAAGPSIGAVSTGTRNIVKGTARGTVTHATPGIVAVRVLGPIRSFNMSMNWLAAWLAHRPFIDAIGPERKLGIRFGGEGTVSVHTVMSAVPPRGFYSMSKFKKLKVPAFGWGISAVPSNQPRFMGKPMSGSTDRVRGPFPPGTIRGVRPPSNGGSVPAGSRATPSSRSRGQGSRPAKKKITPWCPTHRRRHWCRVTRGR